MTTMTPSGQQERAVLRRLKRGPLTPQQALEQLGVYRLAAVVYRLRDAGHPIVTEIVKVPCRSGGAGRIARYHLQRSKDR